MKIVGNINWLYCLMALTIPLCRGKEFEECAGIADETFVSSLTSCSAYIYCDGENSVLGNCNEGEYFDGTSCDDSENVECPLDNIDEDGPADYDEGGDEDDDEEDNSSTSSTSSTMATATTSTPNGSGPTDALTIPPIVKDQCPLTDDPNQIILMANSNSCADYYLCYHGHAIEMHCTNHLHFNSYTGKCDFPENVHCLNDRPNANKCLPHITDLFPHPEKCNYFYYCIKGFMTVQQCPFYYGWDVERRSCVQISQAKCYSSARKHL